MNRVDRIAQQQRQQQINVVSSPLKQQSPSSISKNPQPAKLPVLQPLRTVLGGLKAQYGEAITEAVRAQHFAGIAEEVPISPDSIALAGRLAGRFTDSYRLLQ